MKSVLKSKTSIKNETEIMGSVCKSYRGFEGRQREGLEILYICWGRQLSINSVLDRLRQTVRGHPRWDVALMYLEVDLLQW